MKNYLLIPFFLLFGWHTSNAQVAINNDGADPDNSAVLDIQSSSRGLLAPRMSTSQRDVISNPTAGLIIYNTNTHILELFDGSTWGSVAGEEGAIVLPLVLSGSVLNITATTADAMGEITDLGGDSVIRYGHCWSTYANPTVHFEFSDLGSTDTIGIFTSYLSGLDISTTYYIRAYAENSRGVVYGQEMTFATETSGGNSPCPGTPTLTYGGQVYNTIMIGNQCWMKENLNIGTMIDSDVDQTNNGIFEKYCVYNDAARCAVYGGLYQWNEMMQYVTTESTQGVCPTGWHIPTDTEWSTLESNVSGGGDLKEAGLAHWFAPNTGATDASGYTALPGGYISNNFGSVFSYRDAAWFWTSSQTDALKAWMWDVRYSISTIQRNERLKSFGLSVRCIKD